MSTSSRQTRWKTLVRIWRTCLLSCNSWGLNSQKRSNAGMLSQHSVMLAVSAYSNAVADTGCEKWCVPP